MRREEVEEVVGRVASGLGIAGGVTPSAEKDAVALWDDEFLDYGRLHDALAEAGLPVVSVHKTRWNVEQWDEEEGCEATREERVIAVEFEDGFLDEPSPRPTP